MIDRVNLVE